MVERLEDFRDFLKTEMERWFIRTNPNTPPDHCLKTKFRVPVVRMRREGADDLFGPVLVEPLEQFSMRQYSPFLSAILLFTLTQPTFVASAQSGLTADGFTQNWGTSNPTYDLNGDGTVNALDLGVFLGSVSDASNSDTTPPGSGGNTTQQNSGSMDLSTLPRLTAGTGFASVTAVPTAIGAATDPLSDERAIARWADVPFQTRAETTEIGVVAFHANGIDRVEFSLNGGPWTSVNNATDSSAFGLHCYRARIDFAALPAGAMAEVRAIVYPRNAGQPIVLQNSAATAGQPNGIAGIDGINSYFAYKSPANPVGEIFVAPNGSDANNGTAAQPVKTLTKALDLLRLSGRADGGYVTLTQPGTYVAPATTSVIDNRSWATIRAAEGLAPNSVRIVSVDASGQPIGKNMIRTRVKRLKWERVSFDMSAVKQLYGDTTQYIWVADSIFIDPNGAQYNHANGGTLLIRPGDLMAANYVTNSVATKVVHGFTNNSFVRGCHVDQILGDAYRNTRCVLASSLSNFVGQSTEIHSDVFQYFGEHRNNIVNNFRAWNVNGAQNFFFDKYPGSSFTDCAFVDIAIENLQATPNTPKSQFANESKNLFFAQVSAPNQYWMMRTDIAAPNTFAADSLVFKNCVLSWLSGAVVGVTALPAGVTVSHCHFAVAAGAPSGPQAFSITTGGLRLEFTGTEWVHIGTGAQAIQGSGTPIFGISDLPNPNRGQLPTSELPASSQFAIGQETP